jgi:hypothetical protein
MTRAVGREPDDYAALTLAELAGGAADIIALSSRADNYFSAGRRYSVFRLRAWQDDDDRTRVSVSERVSVAQIVC